MAEKVSNINRLKDYIKGVEERADHHAKNVNEIIYTLIGFIVRYKDAQDIEIKSKDGDLKNVLWLSINDKRFCFSYNHKIGKIEMRKENLGGDAIFEFDNNTLCENIKKHFDSLLD